MNTHFYFKSIMRSVALMIIVCLQSFFISLGAQTPVTSTNEKGITSTDKKIVDNGYFKYEVIGNEMRDIESYKIAKERFMNESPEKYKEMVANVKPVSKHIIDKAEFDKMPANKRNEIVSHPEKYQIQ